jgi:hypothetical protein
MTNVTTAHDLLRIENDECGYLALELSDRPYLVFQIEELQEAGEPEAHARERLAAAPVAFVGRGTASSEYGDHGAYLAVDPVTRRGCVMINYGHGGHDMRAVENVKSLRSELRRTLRAEAADLIALCDGAGKVEIDIDVPSELPRLRAPRRSKRRGVPTT